MAERATASTEVPGVAWFPLRLTICETAISIAADEKRGSTRKAGAIMHRLLVSTAAALALAPAAQAEELGVSFGLAVTSEYVSQGQRLSDGPAFQPYAELGFGGFYFGGYVSNVDPDITLADYEAGLYLGYRGEVGSFSYDVGALYYFYNEAFADSPPTDYGEFVLSGTYGFTENLYLTGRIAHAPEFEQNDLSMTVDYYTALSGLGLAATYGNVDADFGDWNYWSVGANYTVSDMVSFDLTYHDSDADPEIGLVNTDGLFVATLSFDFSLR
jgi:uncharacterized protein (TIGR02001 family)